MRVILILFSFLLVGKVGICQIGQPKVPQYQDVQPVAGANSNLTTGQSQQSIHPPQRNSKQEKELKQLQKDIRETKQKYPEQKIPDNEKSYYSALAELNKMAVNINNFSITEATYIVENAYYNNKYPKSNYDNSIKARVELCKQILKKEHLSESNNLALNYAIQKLYQQDNKYYNPRTKQNTIIPRLKYDFDDWHGDTAYSQMFVSKIFATNKGQCHSLPRLYLILAEKLGAKAFLSNAPEHNFIQFTDTLGHLYNFETTSGVLVSDKFMMQSGFISTAAIKSKIYLDTLSKEQMLALCYVDLANEYVSKFTYTPFVEQLAQKAVQLDPNCIQAHMLLSIVEEVKLEYYAQKLGCTKLEDIPKYPQLKAYYDEREKQYGIIDGLGYQQMPKDAYTDWLKSVEHEKTKQEAEEMQQQVNYQLQFSKVKISTTTKR